jgi:hypothetical protein
MVSDAGAKLEKAYQKEQNDNKNVVPVVVPIAETVAITG